MKHLNLSESEMKELLSLRRDHFLSCLATLLIITSGSFILLQFVLKAYLNIFFVTVLAMAYIAYVIWTNRKYLTEIIRKQKKVYRGALAFKLISPRKKKGKYMFNVDGRVFYVDRKNFECIQEGDIVEFHVSSSTKHLFKIEKVASAQAC